MTVGLRHQRRRLTPPVSAPSWSSSLVHMSEPGRVTVSSSNPPRSDMIVALAFVAVPPPSFSGVPLSEMGPLVIDKGKEVSFPFNSGPSNTVGQQCAISPLGTSGIPSCFILTGEFISIIE